MQGELPAGRRQPGLYKVEFYCNVSAHGFGVGAAIVEQLAKDGYTTVFTYMSSKESALELVKKIAATGGSAHAIKADSANPEEIRAGVNEVVAAYGIIDVVVVNAGILRMNTIDAVPLQELDQMINVNIRGVFLSIQATVPHLVPGARMITIGSNAAIRTGFPGASVYQFTKAAVAGMVKGIALDLATRQITVNNIQPGPTDTDIINADTVKVLSGMSPLKRVATPVEVADLISFLASEKSRYITGASFTIDGGLTL